MRKITFDTVEDTIGAVEDFSDGLGCNVTITSEADGTFMFFGHGEKVAKWTWGMTKMIWRFTKSPENQIQRLDI